MENQIMEFDFPNEVPETEDNTDVLSVDIPLAVSPLPECSTWSKYSPALLRTPRTPLLKVCIGFARGYDNKD